MPSPFSQFRTGYNRKKRIPGVTGKRIPGSERVSPPRKVGGFQTNVPFIKPEAGGSAAFREYHRQQIRDVRGQFAGGWGFAWVGLSALDQAIHQWGEGLDRDIRKAVEEIAKEMKDYMQANAPWQDRTPEERESSGDDPSKSARQELQAQVVWSSETEFTIYLGHGADIYYGIWLEVRWGGRYAIVVPTAQHFAPRLAAEIGTRT